MWNCTGQVGDWGSKSHSLASLVHCPQHCPTSAGNWDLALHPNKVDARQNSGAQGTDRIGTLLSNTVSQAAELHKCDTQHRTLLPPNHKAVVSIPTEGVDFVSADNIDDLPKVNFIFIVLVQMQLYGFHLVQRCVLDTVKNTLLLLQKGVHGGALLQTACI